MKQLSEHNLHFSSIVLNDKRLNATDRLLIAIMASYDHPVKGCFASNALLAKLVNCSIGTISKSIKKMQRLKYITFNGENPEKPGRGYMRRVSSTIKRKTEKKIEKIIPEKKYPTVKHRSA